MNSKRFRFLVTVLAILCLLALAKSFSGRPKDSPRLADSSSAMSPPVAERFSIESVLQRSDLNNKARHLLHDRHARGERSLTQHQIERVIKDSLVVTPSNIPGTSEPRAFRVFSDGSHWEANYEKVDWNSDSYQIMLPSLSTYNAPIGEVEYPLTVPTSVERLKGKYDFYRIGIAHFLKKDLPKISKSDQRMVADYMDQVFDGLQRESKQKIWASLVKDGDTLLAKHSSLSSEGMFQLCRGLAAKNNKDTRMARRLLLEALDQFGTDACPTRCAVFTHNQLWRLGRLYLREKHYLQRWLAMKYWLEKDFRATASEQKHVYEAVGSIVETAAMRLDAELLQDFTAWVGANPKLTPWLKSMLLGRYNLDVAWRHRGEGYANSVSEKSWKKFEDFSKLAHKHFEAAYEFNPRFPEAAAELISISKTGHSTETVEHWFKKATEHEVGYLPAYDNLTVALLPKWSGSYEKAFDFAAQLVKESLAADAPESTSPTVMANMVEAVLKIRNPVLRGAGKWKEFFRQNDRAEVVLRTVGTISGGQFGMAT